MSLTPDAPSPHCPFWVGNQFTLDMSGVEVVGIAVDNAVSCHYYLSIVIGKPCVPLFPMDEYLTYCGEFVLA